MLTMNYFWQQQRFNQPNSGIPADGSYFDNLTLTQHAPANLVWV